MSERHCVVLAGGLGTRIRAVTRGLIPKVLVPVLGRPFLQFKLESLREMGATNVTILAGELGDQIEDFLRTQPVAELSCVVIHDGPKLLGTAGSIARALDFLPERFWVTYGDSYVRANLVAAEKLAEDRGVDAVMVLLHNQDWLETSNVSVHNGLVSRYLKGAPKGTFHWIDYGLLMLPKNAFSSVSTTESTDLFLVIDGLIQRRQIAAFEVSERFWDVGTPDALLATEAEFRRRGMT